MQTDQIRKQIVLRAPRERVWRAISDAKQFGTWFGVEFDSPFVAGAHLTGKIVPTKVDPEVAKMQQPYSGKKFEFSVERIEPKTILMSRGPTGPGGVCTSAVCASLTSVGAAPSPMKTCIPAEKPSPLMVM